MKKLIKFYANWCSPCKALSKNMEGLDLGETLLEEVDIDSDIDKAVKYKIRSVPTLVLEENDIELRRHSGVLTKNQLDSWINGS